jgi:hypothetical protein
MPEPADQPAKPGRSLTGFYIFAVMLLAALVGCDRKRPSEGPASAPWHRGILATVFWVGERGNEASAWDPDWVRNFGGVDDPKRRDGFLPAGFAPKQNPFYCALPYNDVAGRPGVKSTLHGRWVEVCAGGRSCFCRLEDVGPWYVDDRDYVLSGRRPRAEAEGKAGIDLSPAVRDCLGLSGKGLVDWRFVEAPAVPDGPWRGYGK